MSTFCEDRVCVITGAARGIGREYALMLASHGAKVVVNDFGGARDGTGGDAGPAQQVVDEIKAAGGQAVANGSDVSNFAAAQEMIQQAIDTFGRLDVLINNAGILRDKSFKNTTEDLWDPVVEVHLKGTYCVTHAIYNHMLERGEGGVIVNTSSTSGLNGNFGQCNYGAAKAGIAGFSRCLAIEGKKYNIRVCILAPVALTRLTEDLGGFDNEDMKARMDPAAVSPLVTYLASDLAKDITGKTFFCGGGRIAEMKVVTTTGVTKADPSALWTPQEIAEGMQAGQILLPE